MIKFDVNDRIFFGCIFVSLLCIGLLIYYLFDFQVDLTLYFYIWGACSCIIGLCAEHFFVEDDSVGLYDVHFGILLFISGIILIFLIYIISVK